MGDNVKLGGAILFNIPYPSFIIEILSIFRASGRFIWTTCYLIFFASIYIINKYIKANNKEKNKSKKPAVLIIIICLIIQVLDLYPSMNNKFTYVERGYEYNTEEWRQVLINCKHILCIECSVFTHEEFFKMAYIAMQNNCTINNFYFARDVENVKEKEMKDLEELINAVVKDKYAYVLKMKDKDLLDKTKLYCYNIDEYLVVVSKRIDELENKRILL